MKKFLPLLILLCSCANPAPNTTTAVKTDFREGTKPMRARIADYLYPEVNHQHLVDAVPVVTPRPYCYKTWDKPVCYNQPQNGEDERVVGSTVY